MDNYVKFKLMGGPKKIKTNVVPHIFDCQPDRKRSSTHVSRAVAVKRAKRRIIDETLTSSASMIEDQEHKPNASQMGSNSSQSLRTGYQTLDEIDLAARGPEPLLAESFSKKDVCLQARPTVRSKSTQCKLQCGVTIGLSPIKVCPTVVEILSKSSNFVTHMTENSPNKNSSDETYSDSGSVSDYSLTFSETKEIDEEKEEQFKNMSLSCTIRKLQNRPRLYLGLPEYAFYTFGLLEKYCKFNSMYIFLTLKKIRTGDSFISLGDDFGTSEGNASKIFSKSLPVISKFLRKCIMKPETSSVKLNLPVAFRARYSNVYCIIDCLEIEIEKPSDSVKQSLTWSEYKKCNTLKYLISCTPDGIINFISTAFGGRTSDAVIVENCGFLDVLPPNVAIMADRGFKHINHLLAAKGCVLVRPPSVSAGTKPSKDEVFETKRIASLRIHVERVIRRLREYSFLAPHACIDNKLLPHTDNIIKIVCGLINLQSAIITGR